MTRGYSQQEKLKLILNSPKLYIENFIQIPDKTGNMVAFKLNQFQNDFIENREKYNIILKGRQYGFSVLVSALSLYYACTQPTSDILLISYSIDSATAVFDRLKIMYGTIPSVLKPKLLNNNKRELKFTNGSRIVCATAGNKELGRGFSTKLIHCSEFAFWKENAMKQLLALEQSLRPDGQIVIESTANGLNWMEELFRKAQDGENLYKPFFYDWYSEKTMYAEEYENFKQIYINRNGKMLEYEELDDIERQLFNDGATLGQLIWRRMKIGNSSPEQFQQEFPANPLEAFMTTGVTIFDNKVILERARNLKQPIPKTELKDLPALLKQYMGKSFLVWDKPKQGMRYYIGVDTSEGLKRDNSVAEVFDGEGRQVAEFANNVLKPYQFAEIVNTLGRYYNNAYLVVEKASSGISVIEKLRYDYKYMNMHKHKMFDERGKRKRQIGFKTTNKSKTLIINDLKEMFEEGEVLFQSKQLLEEMKTFVADNKGGTGALRGRKDDRVMATALALHGLKQNIWYA